MSQQSGVPAQAPESHTSPQVVDLPAQPFAVVREQVPMAEMTSFFDRAFRAVAEAVARAGFAAEGPPIGLYRGMPTDTVDVTAGFPVPSGTPEGPLGASGAGDATEGSVQVIHLPAGRAAQLLHVGSYDGLASSYDVLMRWMQGQGLVPSDVMWEAYRTEPTPDGDGASMQTLITWPVAE